MMFVAGEIILWILLAFFVGVAVGYAAKGRGGSRRSTRDRRRR
jgi:hypothetical protein